LFGFVAISCFALSVEAATLKMMKRKGSGKKMKRKASSKSIRTLKTNLKFKKRNIKNNSEVKKNIQKDNEPCSCKTIIRLNSLQESPVDSLLTFVHQLIWPCEVF